MVFLDNLKNKKVSMDIESVINCIIKNKYNFHSIEFIECETLDETKHLLSLIQKIDIKEPIIVIKDAKLEKVNYLHLCNDKNYSEFLHLIVNIFGNNIEPIFIERVFSEFIYESLLEKNAPMVVLNTTPVANNPKRYHYSMEFQNINENIVREISSMTRSNKILDSIFPFKNLVEDIWNADKGEKL